MEKEPIGILFNSIRFYSNDDLDKFIKNMTKEQGIYCLLEASKYAYREGIFSLEESEVISKIIRQLSNNE